MREKTTYTTTHTHTRIIPSCSITSHKRLHVYLLVI